MRSETKSRDKRIEEYKNWLLILSGIAIMISQSFYIFYFPNELLNFYEILGISIMFFIGFILAVSGLNCLYECLYKDENEK